MVDEVYRGIDDLPEVVRRKVRRHPDSDARRAVYKQIRDFRGQHVRFGQPVVVVRFEIDGILLDIRE
jgi:hypothetical protein